MHCELCGHDEKPQTENMVEDVTLIVDHLRVMHPEEYGDGPERWSDGGVVIHDETLEPGDFS